MNQIPERTCVICYSKKAPAELLAVTRLKSGEIRINPNHEFFGRSAYICRNKACLEKARKNKKKNVFSYHLKKPFPEELWQELERII